MDRPGVALTPGAERGVPAEPAPPDPERPLFGRALDWRDAACIGPIVLYTLYAWIGAIFVGPQLIGTHPLLNAGLRGSISSLIAVGSFVRVGKVALGAALLVPLPVMMFSDPFWYWAGRRYGRRILDFYAGRDALWQRRVARMERFFRRWGVWTVLLAPYLPVPSVLFYIAAGESRMRFWVFAAADLVANLSWVSLLVSLGWVVGKRGVTVAQAISHYGLWVSLGLLGVFIVWSTVRGRMAGPPRDGTPA